MWFFKIKSQTQTDRGNKFISILSHVQKVESIYSLQTTDQVNEADDLLHRMKAYSSVLLMLLTIKTSSAVGCQIWSFLSGIRCQIVHQIWENTSLAKHKQARKATIAQLNTFHIWFKKIKIHLQQWAQHFSRIRFMVVLFFRLWFTSHFQLVP